MQTHLINEQGNMRWLPGVNPFLAPAGELTIGDLHGNFMMLLFFLITEGVIEGISEEDYETLWFIYFKRTNDLQEIDFEKLKKIISKLKVNTNFKVRLIGDELADRGQNDYFTLLLLQKLQQEQLPMEILLSNHAIEFLKYLTDKDKYSAKIGPVISLSNLITILSKFKNLDDVNQIATNSYKPLLKILSYTLSDDIKEITLFSHAPINIDKIQDLADYFKVDFDDSSAQGLANTIDRINQIFQNEVQNGEILKKIEEVRTAPDPDKHPLGFILWNRNEAINRSHEHKGFKVTYVYGHTGVQGYYAQQSHRINLNGNLGKTPYNNSGQYLLFFQCSTSRLIKYLLDSSKIPDGLKDIIRTNQRSFSSNQIDITTFKKNIVSAFSKLPQNDKTFENYKAVLSLLIDDPKLQRLLIDTAKYGNDFFFQLCDEYFEGYLQKSADSLIKVFTQIKDKIAEEKDETTKLKNLESLYTLFFDYHQNDEYIKLHSDSLRDIGSYANKDLNIFFSEHIFECYAYQQFNSELDARVRREKYISRTRINIRERLPKENDEYFSYVMRRILTSFIGNLTAKTFLAEKLEFNGKINKAGLKQFDDIIQNEEFINCCQSDQPLSIIKFIIQQLQAIPNEDINDENLLKKHFLRQFLIAFISDSEAKLRDTLSNLYEKFKKNPELPRNKAGLEVLDKILESYTSASDQTQMQESLAECIKYIDKSLNIFETHQNIILSRIFIGLSIVTVIPAFFMKMITGNFFMQTDSSKKMKDLKRELTKLTTQNTSQAVVSTSQQPQA